jgi:hypothetical protein
MPLYIGSNKLEELADTSILVNGNLKMSIAEANVQQHGLIAKHATSFNKIGYCGYRAGGSQYYSSGSGWVCNTFLWNSGHYNTGTGVFTCPRPGKYLCVQQGIFNGGGAGNDYGYFAWAKNGAINTFGHVNITTLSSWQQGGVHALFECVTNDTITFHVNQSPAPVNATAVTNNKGLYPDSHGCLWVAFWG